MTKSRTKAKLIGSARSKGRDIEVFQLSDGRKVGLLEVSYAKQGSRYAVFAALTSRVLRGQWELLLTDDLIDLAHEDVER